MLRKCKRFVLCSRTPRGLKMEDIDISKLIEERFSVNRQRLNKFREFFKNKVIQSQEKSKIFTIAKVSGRNKLPQLNQSHEDFDDKLNAYKDNTLAQRFVEFEKSRERSFIKPNKRSKKTSDSLRSLKTVTRTPKNPLPYQNIYRKTPKLPKNCQKYIQKVKDLHFYPKSNLNNQNYLQKTLKSSNNFEESSLKTSNSSKNLIVTLQNPPLRNSRNKETSKVRAVTTGDNQMTKARCNDVLKRVFEFRNTQLAQLQHTRDLATNSKRTFTHINHSNPTTKTSMNAQKQLEGKARSIPHLNIQKFNRDQQKKRTPDMHSKHKFIIKQKPLKNKTFTNEKSVTGSGEVPHPESKPTRLKSLPAVPATTVKKHQESKKNRKKFEKLLNKLKNLQSDLAYYDKDISSKKRLKKSVQFQLP